MYIRALELNHFRNYPEQKIAFEQGTSILFGSNAQGKTNVLEAIFLCSSGRSHRTARDREMIANHAKYARVYAEIVHANGLHSVEVILSRTERKRILVNGIPVSRTGEMLGHLCTVMFSPEDLALIKSSPAARRHFMDLELAQADKQYFYHLQKYLKILQERNSLLKSLRQDARAEQTLGVWNEQLCQAAVPIIEARRDFCDRMRALSSAVHRDISSGREKMELSYVSSLLPEDGNSFTGEKMAELYLTALEQNQKKDLILGTTGIGPHRDDIRLTVNGQELKSFGSQGQQRTAALSLKLAEVTYLAQKRGETPVLLLDDVFSELDTSRQRALVERLRGTQCILTCTGVDHRLFTAAQKLRITAGKIEKL